MFMRKMAPKFAANLNFLFTEGLKSIAERIKAAHAAGFGAVEIPFPNGNEAEVLQAKIDTGIEVSLINIALGSDEYKFGEASIPGAEDNFKQHLADTINLAKQLNCMKIHIMAGITKQEGPDNLATYKKNLVHAANSLEKESLIGVIEPINKYALPGYFMHDYKVASALLREINSKHLRLMVDTYHLQHICGNITNTFKELSDIIGHIQIAQVPHRHEPAVAGELDFKYVFSVIEDLGYKDWIGCEYKPKTTTVEGLNWICEYGYKL